MDNELQIIIDKAFIYESCPQRRRHADHRKELLTNRLISYIEKKLSVCNHEWTEGLLTEEPRRVEIFCCYCGVLKPINESPADKSGNGLEQVTDRREPVRSM